MIEACYRIRCDRCGDTSYPTAQPPILTADTNWRWNGLAYLCPVCAVAEPGFIPAQLESASCAAAMEADRGPSF